MPVILTLTFNPCIDCSTSVEKLLPDIKLRCTQPLYHPGGGGINVARAITRLGGHAEAIFPCGGDHGQKLRKLLRQEQVGFIALAIDGDTRENIVVTETSTGKEFKLTMPGPEINAATTSALLHAIDSQPCIDFLVVSGSIPSTVPSGIFEDIKKITRDKRAYLVVDTSGQALKNAIAVKPDLVKFSVHELAALTDLPPMSDHERIRTTARQLSDNGIETMVVSLGDQGVIWISGDEEGYIPAPRVDTVGSVGAGDSLVAGIVLKSSRNAPIGRAIEYGVACGAAATLHPGTSLCEKKDVDNILHQMTCKITSA